MDDYISRQAAIEAIRKAENHAFNSFYKGLVKAHKIVADLSSADVAPVVRCRECKYWNNGNVTIDCYWDIDGGQPEEMDFCSRGEKKR